MRSSFWRFVLMMLFSLFLLACQRDIRKELVLFDFESDSELDQLVWKCHTVYSLSSEHTTHGTKSLKMELYPSNYPGMTAELKKNDWRGYSALLFDVFNPQEMDLAVTVRIDDKKDYPDYNDRCNQGFVLKPGMNRMSIPLDTVITSRTHRKMDLKNIYRLMIFTGDLREKIVLYLDYLRLI